jgi:hypothetical protein
MQLGMATARVATTIHENAQKAYIVVTTLAVAMLYFATALFYLPGMAVIAL